MLILTRESKAKFCEVHWVFANLDNQPRQSLRTVWFLAVCVIGWMAL